MNSELISTILSDNAESLHQLLQLVVEENRIHMRMMNTLTKASALLKDDYLAIMSKSDLQHNQ